MVGSLERWSLGRGGRSPVEGSPTEHEDRARFEHTPHALREVCERNVVKDKNFKQNLRNKLTLAIANMLHSICK